MKKNRRSKISKPRKPLFYTADPRTSELKYLDELKKNVRKQQQGAAAAQAGHDPFRCRGL